MYLVMTADYVVHGAVACHDGVLVDNLAVVCLQGHTETILPPMPVYPRPKLRLLLTTYLISIQTRAVPITQGFSDFQMTQQWRG